MRKPIQTILFILTAALLFASMLQKWFHWRKFKPLKGVIVEQPKPELRFANCKNGAFQQQTEPYLKQHFGYREPLIRFYNQYLWDFYRKTPVAGGQILIGKDDWIYEPWVVEDYYQKQFLKYAADSAEMASILSKEAFRVYQVQQILEPLGVHLFASLVPSKDLIYPEHLPEDRDTTHRNEPKISARFFLEDAYTRLGVNHLNLERVFLQMKDTADFPLFPQTGTHWSKYACLYAADTLIRYMEHLGNINMKNLVIGARELDNARDPDDDLESLMNLLRPLRKPKYWYAQTHSDGDTTAVKPKMILIGDSFWWTVVLQIPLQELFSSAPYWYYNSTIYYDEGHASVDEVNLVDELLSADFINLFYSSTQLYRLNNDFTKKALMALCYDPEEIEAVNKEISQFIRTDSTWMARLRKQAESDNRPLEEVIHSEAQWLIDHNPEKYFPELNDSVPQKRSKRVEAILGTDSLAFIELEVERTIQKLKNNEVSLESIREKALQQNKTLEQAIRDDARWIVNYKLEQGTLQMPNVKKK